MKGVKGDKLIRKVLNSKKKLRSTGFTVGCVSNEDPENRALVVISKKIFKKANKRNKLRRRIKAVLIKHQDIVFKTNNIVCIQVFSKELLLIEYSELEKKLLDIFYKIIT
jgi:ribonuclease P protein component